MKRLLFLLMFVPQVAISGGLKDADIVILGEIHDNPDVHIGQAKVLGDLKPSAVVFEMLTPALAQKMESDRSRIPDLWPEETWLDYALYAPIFDALGQANLVGAASPRETIDTVFAEGPSEAFGAEADAFGLSVPLPDVEQRAREALQFEAHCEAMPRGMMPNMINVQRFRDARFAQTALSALAEHGPPVAVIVGAGHARNDWGVPAAIALRAPDVRVYSIAFLEIDEGAPFDEIRIVPQAERSDPCDAFK